VVSNADALKKCPALRHGQGLVQLRLSHEKDVDQFLIRSLHVGKKPHLFQEIKGQLVGLVDDQQKGLLVLEAILQELLELIKKLGLGLEVDFALEGRKSDVVQELFP